MDTATPILNRETQGVNLASGSSARPAGIDPLDRVEPNGKERQPLLVKKRRRTFKRLALVAGILAAVIGAVIFFHDWWTVGRFIESTDDAYVGGDVTVIAPKVAGFI